MIILMTFHSTQSGIIMYCSSIWLERIHFSVSNPECCSKVSRKSLARYGRFKVAVSYTVEVSGGGVSFIKYTFWLSGYINCLLKIHCFRKGIPVICIRLLRSALWSKYRVCFLSLHCLIETTNTCNLFWNHLLHLRKDCTESLAY